MDIQDQKQREAGLKLSKRSRKNLELVGTSQGLAQPCGHERPEQLYVWTDPDSVDRPVVIESCDGYDVEARLKLTRRQAINLIHLLTQAVAPDEDPRTVAKR